MNVKYKSNNNIVYSCKYHVVWCPKYRRKVLTNGVDVRLKELLLEYAANLSVDILEMEIMPDHVHILMEVAPQFGIHKAVKSLKGYTSKVLRSEYPFLKTRMPTLWTNILCLQWAVLLWKSLSNILKTRKHHNGKRIS